MTAAGAGGVALALSPAAAPAASTATPATPPSPAAPAASAAGIIPASMLYWASLPAAAQHRSTQALRYHFERLLPMPVETLHTVHTTLPGGDVLIIGIEPARLRMFLAQQDVRAPGLWSLTPDTVPPHLATGGIAAGALQQLNLLTGMFEPAARRRLRLIGAGVIHAGLAVATAIVLWGIDRHAAVIDAHAVGQQAAVSQELDLALPRQPGVKLPGELRLTMELRTLDLAAHSPTASSFDVADVLDRLWAVWPAKLRMQAETITATDERIVVRGTVPSLAEAERLATSCAEVSASGARYRAEPLQAQAGEHGTNVLLTLIRVHGARP